MGLIIQENVQLAPLTTIQLGGRARYFAECASVEDVREALTYAATEGLPIHVLGGGSNTIFSDDGFDGLVMHVNLQGIEFTPAGEFVMARAAAGEEWDAFVRQCIEKGAAGVEALVGIPGLVGATPMQNVGAYGQEVSDTIVSVKAIDRDTMEAVNFLWEDCQFEYRGSRFKYADAGRYIITEVLYQLRADGKPIISYPQVAERVGEDASLQEVQEAVLALRRGKSMVIDERDPNTRSCGSFFMNPVVPNEKLEEIQKQYPEVPYFEGEESEQASAAADWVGSGVKISAAWLIEQAGFSKGMRRGGIGISENHVLALVNRGGNARELIAFAGEIQRTVEDTFGIQLVREPVLVE